jgi:hypothetical protein
MERKRRITYIRASIYRSGSVRGRSKFAFGTRILRTLDSVIVL